MVFETLDARDVKLRHLWDMFEDVPMNPDTECMEEEFLTFPIGTHREEIWHWFDERYSKGVAHLLYEDGVDRTDDVAEYIYRKSLCVECDCYTCIFNCQGVCHKPLICGDKPKIKNGERGDETYAVCWSYRDMDWVHDGRYVMQEPSERVSCDSLKSGDYILIETEFKSTGIDAEDVAVVKVNKEEKEVICRSLETIPQKTAIPYGKVIALSSRNAPHAKIGHDEGYYVLTEEYRGELTAKWDGKDYWE